MAVRIKFTPLLPHPEPVAGSTEGTATNIIVIFGRFAVGIQSFKVDVIISVDSLAISPLL